MRWSDLAWESIDSIYQSIIGMPFLRELADSSLPLEKFQFYLAQDSLYLEQFGRTLSLIGVKAHRIEEALAYMRFGENALLVENALHESYFSYFGIDDKGIMQPACHHYIHFLRSTAALDPVEVAMAATLPCFWIYREVGEKILAEYSPEQHPYRKWIETYGGEEFGLAVTTAIELCDQAALNTSPGIRERMHEAFMIASRMEYAFWDAAYHQRTWEAEAGIRQRN